MAKWINFHVTGGHDGAAVAPLQDGDNLLLADSICAVQVTNAGGGAAMTAVLTLTNAAAGADVCTVLVGTNAAATDPGAAVPTSAGYAVKVKEAINRALTANPGGVKSTCGLPQDSDAQAEYSFANTVYFKSFVIS